MRSPLILVVLFAACKPDTSVDTDQAETDTNADTDSDADTDTDSDTDTDTDSNPDAPDADFLANGPGEGTLFDVNALDLGANACAVNESAYTLTWANGLAVKYVLPAENKLTVHTGGSWSQDHACVYEDADGSYTCATAYQTVNLNDSSTPLDAVISYELTVHGRFAARTVDVEGGPHDFGTRWAADSGFTLDMSCTGSACGIAASYAGLEGGLPCQTVGVSSTVNLDDPSL